MIINRGRGIWDLKNHLKNLSGSWLLKGLCILFKSLLWSLRSQLSTEYLCSIQFLFMYKNPWISLPQNYSLPSSPLYFSFWLVKFHTSAHHQLCPQSRGHSVFQCALSQCQGAWLGAAPTGKFLSHYFLVCFPLQLNFYILSYKYFESLFAPLILNFLLHINYSHFLIFS